MTNNDSEKKISRNATCPCGSGKKYKKCCLVKKDTAETSNRIIKEFQFDKHQKALVHPLSPTKKVSSGLSIDVYLITLGHLWIYQLIENNGYDNYLIDLVQLSVEEKNSLLEWDIQLEQEEQIRKILKKYNMDLKKYLDEDFDILNYSEILGKSKDKEHPYHRLTRLLLLGKEGTAQEIFNLGCGNIEDYLIESGTIINSTYLLVEMLAKQNGKSLITIPDFLLDIINKNMECRVEHSELKYYPKSDIIISKLSSIENIFANNWYLIPDDEQVIISKFLYSIRIVKELVVSLLGLNGILSSFVTRTLFDNYWQSRLLIEKNEVTKYREFALDRMRLHILKRSDGDDITRIDDLLSEVDGGVFDPIPINGDYFTKSAREYAIELDIKEDYDKYYEYNSEFIHASLTAVYSGIMARCINPEHDRHLTIHPGGSRLIKSVPHIFEILNKHVELLNSYLDDEIVEKFDIDELFFKDRVEFLENLSKLEINS